MSNDPYKHIQTRNNELVVNRLQNLRAQNPFSLEPAGMVDGVVVVNDSASTNIELVATSLLAFESPVVWIMESNVQIDELEMLGDIVKDKVKAVVVMGHQADAVHNVLWKSLGLFISAQSWEEALEMGLGAAKTNDTLLFSPGCRASEPFRNFRERGTYFNQLLDIKRKTNPLNL